MLGRRLLRALLHETEKEFTMSIHHDHRRLAHDHLTKAKEHLALAKLPNAAHAEANDGIDSILDCLKDLMSEGEKADA